VQPFVLNKIIFKKLKYIITFIACFLDFDIGFHHIFVLRKWKKPVKAGLHTGTF